MKTDVLFWFYKDFDTCQDRLQRFRNFNKKINIFALYGGPISNADQAVAIIGPWVDDIYIFRQDKDKEWKWKHGDLMINSWYLERGKDLHWDTIFIMQWDMLIVDSTENLFKNLNPGQILLSGYCLLNQVAEKWYWAKPAHSDIRAFTALIESEYGYQGPLYACQYIVICLPRIFLERYVDIKQPETGFLEYKVPTMAKIFNIPVCKDHQFKVWWPADPKLNILEKRKLFINAKAIEIPFSVILSELSKQDGGRLFHPVYRIIPNWCYQKLLAKIIWPVYFAYELFFKVRNKLYIFYNKKI